MWFYWAIVFAAVLAVAEAAFTIFGFRTAGRCSAGAEGTVKAIETVEPWAKGFFGRRPYRRYRVTYEYVCDGVTHSMNGISRVRNPKCKIGDTELIMYNPSDFSEAYSGFDKRQLAGNYTVTLLVIILLLVFALILK